MTNSYRLLFLIGICTLLSGCAFSSGGKTTVAIIACLIAVVAAAIGQFQCGREDRVCRKAEQLDQSLQEHVSKYHGTDIDREKVVELKVVQKDEPPVKIAQIK